MRTRKRKLGSKEEIIEYTHNIDGRIVCVVGHGEADENGNFVATFPQNYDFYSIHGAAYQELMEANPETGKPAGMFTREDLWPFIDVAIEEQMNVAKARATRNE